MNDPKPRDIVLISCQLGRSAFSGERIFWIAPPTGGECAGAASVDYCFRDDLAPLSEDEPAPKQRLKGHVVGKIVSVETTRIRVEVPDGGVVDIRPAQISHQRKVVTTWEPRKE